MFVCVYSGSRVYKTTSINRQWNGIQNMYVRLFSLQFLPKQHTKWRKKNKENWNKEDIRTQNSRYGAVLCTQIIQLDVCVCVCVIWKSWMKWETTLMTLSCFHCLKMLRCDTIFRFNSVRYCFNALRIFFLPPTPILFDLSVSLSLVLLLFYLFICFSPAHLYIFLPTLI